MDKRRSSKERKAADREYRAAEQQVREYLSEFTPERRNALKELSGGAVINEYLERAERRLGKSV